MKSLIDNYIRTSATPSQTRELKRIQKIIEQTIPNTTESISYGIPTIKYKGKNLIHFAAFKNHMSLFPGSGPIEALSNKLTKFKLSKGTIQFTEGKPIPEKTIKELALIRKKDIEHKSK